jgi:predicted DNA-binding ribbon-helix-helix protein
VTSLQASSAQIKSPIAKRSIVIGKHKTSVSLEDAFWSSLKEIADKRTMTISQLVSHIDSQRRDTNLSSAIRLFVLDHFRSFTVEKYSFHDAMHGATTKNRTDCTDPKGGTLGQSGLQETVDR